MPLPSDEQILKTSQDLVTQLQTISGNYPGFRPGIPPSTISTHLLTDKHRYSSRSRVDARWHLHTHPSSQRTLYCTPFNTPSTPVTLRFSSSTGIPQVSDTDPSANPRGLGIRFNLGAHVHTDIIAHSTPFFPTRTGAGFLEMLRAIAASPPGTPSPSPIEKFLGANPTALAFVQASKPTPSSFAREAFYAVNALKFVNAEGKSTYFRYWILLVAGEDHLDEVTTKDRAPDFLFEELQKRVADETVTFRVIAQLAEEGDEVNDATVHWPENRQIVELGTVKIGAVLPENTKEQKRIIYDVIPRVEGIETSDDPLLEMRATVYLISGRERRAAP